MPHRRIAKVLLGAARDARRGQGFRDVSGATAIEYGLIAGLIALGIVGSLVGTRASLNADLNAVSSGLSPASPTFAPDMTASTSPRKAFWTGKTLSSATSTSDGSKTTATYTFKDGTVANLVKDLSTGNLSMSWIDPNYMNNGRPNGMRMNATAAGYPTFYGLYGYNAAGTYISDSYVSSNGTSFNGNPPLPAQYDTTYYNANGTVSSQIRNQGTGSIAGPATDGYNDLRYFIDITK